MAVAIQKKVEEIIKAIAKKYNKPYHVVLEAYISQFKRLREEMKKKEFKTVKLPSWGKYIVSQGKLAKIDYAAKDARYEAKYGKKDSNNEEGTKDN